MLVKYLLVGFVRGYRLEREIAQHIDTDWSLRWYLGLDLFDRVPDHSTISQLRRRKPAFRKVFRRLFEEVVRQCIEHGLVSGRLALTDSTHIKANASYASEQTKKCLNRQGRTRERNPLQAAAADSAYDMGLAHRILAEHGTDIFVPTKQVHDRTKAELKREAFSYDGARDVYVCPEGRLLKLNTLRRSASGLYWAYTSDKAECASCMLKLKCLGDGQKVRRIERSYFDPQRQRSRLHVGSPAYRDANFRPPDTRPL